MSQDKNVELIVSMYDPQSRSIYGENIVRQKMSLGDTLSCSRLHVGKDKAVIIRPSYNEKLEDGQSFFREWRSFNGEMFQECRWYYDS